MVIWLIDISNHQGAFDVGRAVAEGYSGVWMKATEGTSFRDGMFDTFARQTIAAGAVPGAYHFLRSGSGRAQCDAFYRRIRDHGGPEGWLVACDNEVDASWQTTVDFFARWRELAGDHPMFMYSGNWWWSERGWNGAALTPYLWDSRYVSGSGYGSSLYAKVPASWWSSRYGGWGNVTVLQFSSSAVVAGRSPVDVNAFRGSLDDLRMLARDGGSGPVVVAGGKGTAMLLARNGATIVLTDWSTWHDRTITYERCMGMQAAGIPLVDVTVDEIGRILGLPAPGVTQVGGVDVAALASALAALLPVVPSAAEVADAVVDEEASRLAG